MQHFIINQVRRGGSDTTDPTETMDTQPPSTLFTLCCWAILWVLFLFTCNLPSWGSQTILWLRIGANSRGFAGVNWGLMWFVLLALQEALPSPLKRLPCDYALMASVSYMCFKQPSSATYQMIRLMLQRHKVEKHLRNLSLKCRRPYWSCFSAEPKPEGQGGPLLLSSAANPCRCASNSPNYWVCRVRICEQRSKQSRSRLEMRGGVHMDLPSRFHNESSVSLQWTPEAFAQPSLGENNYTLQ